MCELNGITDDLSTEQKALINRYTAVDMKRRVFLGVVGTTTAGFAGCLNNDETDDEEAKFSPSEVSTARIKRCEEAYIGEEFKASPTPSIISKKSYNEEWVAVEVDSSWGSRSIGAEGLVLQPADSSAAPGDAASSTEDPFSDLDTLHTYLSEVVDNNERKFIPDHTDQYETIIDSLVRRFGDDVKRDGNEQEGKAVFINHNGELVEVQEAAEADAVDHEVMATYFVSETEIYRGENIQKPTDGTLMDC